MLDCFTKNIIGNKVTHTNRLCSLGHILVTVMDPTYEPIDVHLLCSDQKANKKTTCNKKEILDNKCNIEINERKR